MQELKKNLSHYPIDQSWTLFLDRDGVINKRLVDDYVKTWDEFEFLPGVKEVLSKFSNVFGRIIIVSNQQGIGKGLMNEDDLNEIHSRMLSEIEESGGRIDAFYHCPELKENNSECRKPKAGMALQAQKEFPEIDFSKSIMVGDSSSDMEFGKNLGMLTVFVGEKVGSANISSDFVFMDLQAFSKNF